MGTGPREPVGSSHSLMAAGDVRGIEDEPTLIGHSSSAAVSGRCSHALAGPKGWRGPFSLHRGPPLRRRRDCRSGNIDDSELLVMLFQLKADFPRRDNQTKPENYRPRRRDSASRYIGWFLRHPVSCRR